MNVQNFRYMYLLVYRFSIAHEISDKSGERGWVGAKTRSINWKTGVVADVDDACFTVCNSHRSNLPYYSCVCLSKLAIIRQNVRYATSKIKRKKNKMQDPIFARYGQWSEYELLSDFVMNRVDVCVRNQFAGFC